LGEHFGTVVKAEAVEAEPEALALIARAAEGSVRDGLSILDQAIAHAHGNVSAAQVREMLGLSDRGAIRTLFGHLLAGDGPAALTALRGQYDLGVDPVAVFRGLLETCHGVTRAKVGGHQDSALSAEEREAFADWASGLGFAALHRMWQLLLKGHGEVTTAPMPLEAAEMALLRIVYAASLPDPGELARKLASGETVPPSVAAPATPSEEQQPFLSLPLNFRDLVRFLEENGQNGVAQDLINRFGLVRYAPPELALKQLKPSADLDLVRKISLALKEATRQSWSVLLDDGPSDPSLFDQQKIAEEQLRAKVEEIPIVKAALEAFPGALLLPETGIDENWRVLP